MNSVHVKCCLLALLLLLGLNETIWAVSENMPGLKKEELSVGYIHGQFQEVNPLDAEAAFKTLSRTLGVKQGYDVHVTVESFENGREVNAYMQYSPLQLIIYNSLDYLQTANSRSVEPLFVPAEDGHVLRQYVLLTRDTGLDTLEDLRGRSLNIYYGPNSSLAVKWLEVLLRKHENTDIDSFFSSVHKHADPLAAILPVFLGKRDVVLVDADKFDLMAELNPQLSKLSAIVASEPYLCQLVCFSRSGWGSAEFKDAMLQAMTKLHENQAGRQILLLFKADKIVPFEPHYLESAMRLERNELNMQGGVAQERPEKQRPEKGVCQLCP